MPTLKHITCNVEWASTNSPLQEHQTTYTDGYVETHIAVPPLPTAFCIHLQSSGYIAPGLAMFVYIDGVYQCNRNRHNLKTPDKATSRSQTEISFRVRQKEERRSDGTFEGKQWRFEKVNIGMPAGLLEVVDFLIMCFSFRSKYRGKPACTPRRSICWHHRGCCPSMLSLRYVYAT